MLDLEPSALSKSSSWICHRQPRLLAFRICSQPVSLKAAKFSLWFPAAKAARPPLWNLYSGAGNGR
ncbi:hypothetical protein KCP75_18510 [Salmonella enterica subsp. enterica]|nr:hypothetical protein KCP75_18510 [Salmonella enterica subsp. enterica]